MDGLVSNLGSLLSSSLALKGPTQPLLYLPLPISDPNSPTCSHPEIFDLSWRAHKVWRAFCWASHGVSVVRQTALLVHFHKGL